MMTDTPVYRPNLIKKIVSKCRKLIVNNNNRRFHFTIFVLGNRIIYISRNKERQTHPIGMLFGHRFSNIHSEFGILDQRFDFRMKIFNIRFARDGSIKKSTPCIYCKSLLKKGGITEIFEIIDNNYFKKVYI